MSQGYVRLCYAFSVGRVPAVVTFTVDACGPGMLSYVSKLLLYNSACFVPLILFPGLLDFFIHY